MKKTILLLFLISCCWTGVSAQSWLLYDASKLPAETGDEPLDLTSLSQNAPGDNFVEEILEDPQIPGNQILRYVQPDVTNTDGSEDATKMYRFYLRDAEGNDWSGTQMTLVARVKGLEDWESLGLDRVFDIQYRNANTDSRDELRLDYDMPAVRLDRSNASADFPEGFVDDWHIFRIVVDGNTSSVYVDESPVPITTGTSTSGTGDIYLKIGDGSSSTVGGLLDWFAVDTTGAYTPAQSPLDERFTGAPEPFTPSNYKIAFITKDVTPEGDLEEGGIISDLRRRGFQVDVTYNDPSDIVAPTDFDFTFEALDDYDLVIIGRGVSSGDFTEAQSWANVTTPIIHFSAYVVRSSRLKLINTTSASREVDDGTTVDSNRVTDIAIEDPFHPIYTNLDQDFDGRLGYHTWFYDYVGYGADTFATNHNATLLASLEADGQPGDGNVYVALWDAGVEPYPGAGITFGGSRMYFQMGSDDSSSPKLRNFTAFTEESTALFHNAIKLLLGEDPDGGIIPTQGPVALWKFDEVTGEFVDDAIGSADGEIRNGNGITYVDCGVNNSINFSGATKTDAVVWVEDHPSVNFSGEQSFTVSLLAKIDPHTNTSEMNLVLKGDNADGSALPNGNGHWYSVATKDNELRFAVDDNVTKTQLGVAIDETSFPAGEWNHIVAVRDREADSLFLYLNGARFGALLDETEDDISTTGLPLVIGNYHSASRLVNGGLDEIGIYSEALSADDVAALYNSVSTTNDCNVIETITEASDDATLSELSVSAGTLVPEFDPTINNYQVELPEGTGSVTITATANHPEATVSGAGEFTNIPGTAVITVTAQDSSTRDYNISFSIEGAANSKTVVEPGFENLSLAIQAAVDGDTLVLRNGEVYTPLEPYQINKKVVIIAEEIPSLPGLANMPVIENLFAVSPVFQLNFGADLHLIGIDVDGQQAANLFDARGDVGVSSVLSVYINRCRLHNTTEDIFNDARDGGGDNTVLSSCKVINSFVYDSGGGHGLYIKNYAGSNEPYVFENLTFWNLGQQFNWIRHYDGDDAQQFIYNHNTGYNLSTDAGQNKELFGNSDGEGEAALDIDFKNNILHTQASDNEGSLKFNNTSERHSIRIANNVLFEVQPIVNLGGTIEESNNQIDVDPQFADPENGDFTVMNTALYDAADDGEIVGAVYWHPDFVDDFSDLTTSVREVVVPASDFGLKTVPNPFHDRTMITFNLKKGGTTILRIFDLTGKQVKNWRGDLPAGEQQLLITTDDLKPGMYIYQLSCNGMTAGAKMIKQ